MTVDKQRDELIKEGRLALRGETVIQKHAPLA
jgi:hypothetical protein